MRDNKRIVLIRPAAETSRMQRPRSEHRSAVLSLLLCSSLLTPAHAFPQGLAGSEVSGVVRFPNGNPAVDALVLLVDRNSGAERRTRTASSGHYRFENVDVGQYRLEARSIGSKAASADQIELHLGDRVRIDIVLGSAATVLNDAVVRASR